MILVMRISSLSIPSVVRAGFMSAFCEGCGVFVVAEELFMRVRRVRRSRVFMGEFVRYLCFDGEEVGGVFRGRLLLRLSSSSGTFLRWLGF